MTRAELKAVCLALLDEYAVEHPAGHQGKLAARYVLRSRAGERIGLMFEKHEATPANLWVDRRYASNLLDTGAEVRAYPASALYLPTEPGAKRQYGRHAALKAMRDLAHVDLVRFTIDRPDQLLKVLTHLVFV